MEIPSFLSHLPVYAGLPVPFTQLFVNGIPSFRAIDGEKVYECIRFIRCGICGLDLEEFACFLGGPLSKDNHIFIDVWMHENCARFASRACPFVSGSKMEYSGRPVSDEMHVELAVAAIRPSAMYLMKARTADCMPAKMGESLVIHAGKWLGVEDIASGG
jgi:hypothetical protein